MNKNIFSLAAIAASLGMAAGFSSCDDEQALPPVYDPTDVYERIEPNISILELKEAFFTGAGNDYATEVGTNEDGQDYIIRGRIVSNTASGNVFKYVMVEDGTACMAFSIDNSKLDETIIGQYGAEIAVNMTGLYLGTYRNNLICGTKTDEYQNPSRLTTAQWEAVATPQSAPDPREVVPFELTAAEVMSFKGNDTELLTWQNRLVTIKDLRFETPGEPFAESGANTTRYLVAETGQRFQLRNSGYSDWWFNLMPEGTGSVTAILGYYNTDWQLQLNDPADLVGFTPATPPVEAAGETIFSESFASSLGNFTIENIAMPAGLSYIWSSDTRYTCAKAQGFASGQAYDTDSRLVSPEIDLAGTKNVTVNFEHAGNYFADAETAKQEATFEVSEDGSNWTKVEIPNYFSSFTFVKSGTIDLKAYAGKKIRIAFRYKSTAAKAGTWEVKNVNVAVDR
ncbi:MAG: DUF5689 domain-containing protein [[Clostridium] fimetarium]|nr:DUF5689 domain-containing protein [Alistipes timonensis]MCM1405635.1 DUF5689 domain-containing protein [[Clostridium] fimetarium]